MINCVQSLPCKAIMSLGAPIAAFQPAHVTLIAFTANQPRQLGRGGAPACTSCAW